MNLKGMALTALALMALTQAGGALGQAPPASGQAPPASGQAPAASRSRPPNDAPAGPAPLATVAAAPEPGIGDAAAEGDVEAVKAFIGRRVDVNAPSLDGTPALHWIVRMQDIDMAKRLLKAGADANRANRYGLRPLHLAINNGDLPMVRVLLAAKADPNSANAPGETCLIMAARVGNPDIVKALLAKGAAVDASDPAFGQTPLMLAARFGHVPIAQLLIERGAKVDAQTRTGATAKFRTPASNSGSKGMGIIRGGWPERGERDPTPGAKTPLLYAAREGHDDVAKLLLDKGASIEKADADGVTPLLMATLNGKLSLAKLLIDRGANVNVSDWYGQTPLWAAIDWRNIEVPGPTRNNGVDREATFGLIQALLGKGANPNVRTKEYPPLHRWIMRLGSFAWADLTGQTPFLRAAAAGDVKTMRLLLDHGADPNIKTFNGTTPLMAAAGINWTVAQTYDEGPEHLLEAVKLAHSLGNDVNAMNDMGLQAVHGAANRGLDEVIKFLAHKGAKLDVPDKQGRTPMIWAKGVFLATHPPEAKPRTIALLEQLQGG